MKGIAKHGSQLASTVLDKAVYILCLSFITSCSGIQHQVPEATPAAEQQAWAEISNEAISRQPRLVSEVEAREALNRVHNRILPEATAVCEYVEEQDSCHWEVTYSDDADFNAYATDDNDIVVYHGVMSRVLTDDELAFVLAHEMAHHIAEHLEEQQEQAVAGALIGALAAGVIAYNAGPCYTAACQQNTSDLIESSAQLGAIVAERSYSADQEKEADYLSAYIIYRSGYDLFEARNTILYMGNVSGEQKTGFLATHPAGPERLATFDKVVEVIYFDDDVLPNKVELTKHSNSKKDKRGPRR